MGPIEGHRDPALSVAFSPDGKYVISESYDCVRLWDVKTGEAVRGAYSGAITSVSFDCTIRVWDLETGRATLKPFRGHTPIIFISFPLDGEYIASSSEDRTIRLWNAKTGEVTLKLFFRPPAYRNL